MRRKQVFILSLLVMTFFVLPKISLAGYECRHTSAIIPEGMEVEAQACADKYETCQDENSATLKVWQNCTGWGADEGVNGCNGNTREAWLINPTLCPENYKEATQFQSEYDWGQANYNYCACVEKCGDQPVAKDCMPVLTSCCQALEEDEEVEEEIIDDQYCQENYGLAHADEEALNGCRCDIPDAKMNPASGKCEYTKEYLDADCAQKKGAAYWDETSKDCYCLEFTEYNQSTGKCEDEDLLITQARQELQYAFYDQIINKGLAMNGDVRKAANIALGLSTDDATMDTGELRTLLTERQTMYQQMSEWHLSYTDTIKKAAEILKGKKVEVGRVKLTVEDESTIYSMINDNWLMLLTGKVKVDGQIQDLKIGTATKLIRPKGTAYSVEYNLENGFEEIKVLEGTVEVIDLDNNLTTQEVTAGQAYTAEIKDNFSWTNWLILSISLALGLIGLIVAIIIGIKKKKFLIPFLIFLPFLLVSLLLLGIFIYKGVVYLGQENSFTLADTGEVLVREEVPEVVEEVVAEEVVEKEVVETQTEEEKLGEEGKILNKKYNFVLQVGKKYVDQVRMVNNNYDGVKDSIMYCFDTAEEQEDAYVCEPGEVSLFSVNVLTKKQWEEDKVSPFAGTLLGKKDDLFYVFYHPNGILPADTPSDPEYYEKVVESFYFAE